MTDVTDDIADAIGEIEKLRLATENDAGSTMACSAALHRLHELLHYETEALRLRGPASAHLANAEAVSIEIGRVKKLSIVAPERRTCKSVGRGGDR